MREIKEKDIDSFFLVRKINITRKNEGGKDMEMKDQLLIYRSIASAIV